MSIMAIVDEKRVGRLQRVHAPRISDAKRAGEVK